MVNTTLQKLREAVRKYIGMSTAAQISNEELNAEINYFYTETLPSLIYFDELRDFYSFNATDQEEQLLPDEVINIFPPCKIDNEIAGFYYNPTLFWSKYAGATAGTPKDVLLMGRTLRLGPPADISGPYAVMMVSTKKPAMLQIDSDSIISDKLKNVIELGTSISILLKQGDENAALFMQQYIAQYLSALQSLDVRVDIQALKDTWEKSNTQPPTGVQQTLQAPQT